MPTPPGSPCAIEGCPNDRWARGWCNAHYKRWRRNGDPEGGENRWGGFPTNLLRRLMFMPPTTMPTGCIEFTGPKTWAGYGLLGIKRSNAYAHRASYELVKGPIPEGLEIDHLCRNTSCVNPGHLEAVTRQENMRRYHEARRASA